MASKIYIVKQIDKTWVVQREDAKSPSAKFEKKTDAVARGKELAEKIKGELHVLKVDGTVDQKKSYVPVEKPAAKSAAKPATKPAAKPAVKPAAKPMAKCAPKAAAAKPVAKPAAKPAPAKKAAAPKAPAKPKK